jgi:hypothetical protein
MSTIETIAQKIEISGVGDIVVTPVEQDLDVGDFVREPPPPLPTKDDV